MLRRLKLRLIKRADGYYVDSLKIDKYFVDDMMVDDKALVLISSMIEMGHKLGYEITVEGVETSEQFNTLKNLGCKNVQGYLFSRPRQFQ
jgi:EAL domain-containing protein (putative c-di-GMP-specific phosphodiesterase class I)